MNISRVRSALLGTAVGVAMVAASGTANALEYNFGGVQVFFDTTVTAGVSMRVAETNKLFLPAGNGGPSTSLADVQTPDGVRTLTDSAGAVTVPTAATGITAFAPGGGQALTFNYASGTANGGFVSDAFAGSINGDDGRLNFDRGDLTSGVVKMTNDIQVNWSNFTVFARLNSFYDAVLDNNSSYARSGIQDGARVDVARDIDLLDFYVSGDFNLGNLPLNIRLGKQVVNWGEATFILNGISSWSPFDVNAFRRPGAEVKEGLLPVWGAYASLGLPYDLSLELFYQLKYDELQLDRPGTPFSTSDVARVGSAQGGNVGAATWLTGGSSGGAFFNRNCSTADALTADFDMAYIAAGLTQFVCGPLGTNQYLDYTVDLPIGQSEAFRLALNGGTSDVARDPDRFAKDTGQYGVALRWYSEALNSTEFGFYFMNYHSRLPLVSERLTIAANGGTNSVYRTYNAVGENGAAVARTTALNCGTEIFGGGTQEANAGELALALGGTAKLNYLNSVIVADTYGIFAAAELHVAGGDAKALASAAVIAAVGGAINDFSLLEEMVLNCALAFDQVDAGSGVLVDGTELVVAGTAVGGTPAIGLFLEYPEDIKLFGVSFNTTVGDWGVQGEVAFRHDQPFQLDTDQLTIAALGASCIFDSILGVDSVTAGVDGGQTIGNSSCGSVAQGSTQEYTGFVREEVVTFDIGTTATYTNSHPLIGALGADIGILLTEVGAMYVPDAPSEGDFSQAQWGNVCTSGTDLPLKGFLALSTRNGCRPSEFSYGYVLVGILQYNNAFGTPITVSPQIAWSHDVKGNSPAPMSNYREGRKRISLSVNGTYQSTWRGGISYVNGFGNEKYNSTGDQDFVAVNLSYSF